VYQDQQNQDIDLMPQNPHYYPGEFSNINSTGATIYGAYYPKPSDVYPISESELRVSTQEKLIESQTRIVLPPENQD
jgi:hypothetical protein